MVNQSMKEILKDHTACQLRNAGDGVAEIVRGPRTVASITWAELFDMVRNGESSSETMIYRNLIHQWASRNDVCQNLLRKAAPDLYVSICEQPALGDQNEFLDNLLEWRSCIQNNYIIGVSVLVVGVICLIGSFFLNRQLYMKVVPSNRLSVPQKIEACNRIIQQQEETGYEIFFDIKMVVDLYQQCQADASEDNLSSEQQQMSQKIQQVISNWQSKHTDL